MLLSLSIGVLICLFPVFVSLTTAPVGSFVCGPLSGENAELWYCH